MKNAVILIAFALAIIVGTAAEAVETHQAVVYATTSERIAVGTSITGRPPHRSVRAGFPHTAPTLGV